MEFRKKEVIDKKDLDKEVEKAMKNEKCVPVVSKVVNGELEIKFLKEGLISTDAVEEMAKQIFDMGKESKTRDDFGKLLKDVRRSELLKGFAFILIIVTLGIMIARVIWNF